MLKLNKVIEQSINTMVVIINTGTEVVNQNVLGSY